MPSSPFSVRPASSHPVVGLLFARCLARQHPCGTTTKGSPSFNFASQRGQSSSCAARLVSKTLRPAQWQSSRDEIRCAVSKRAIRRLASNATQSGKGNASPRPVAKRKLITQIHAIVQPSDGTIARRRRRLQRIIQYTFNDGHYFRACISQEIKIGDKVLPRVQPQLAIIGDCLIKMIWYAEKFPMPDPVLGNGRWTHIATNEALARIAYTHDLASLVEVHQGNGTTLASRSLGTLVEAIIGAVYLDSGHDYTATRDVMARLRLLDPAFMTQGGAKPVTRPQRTHVKAKKSIRITIKRRARRPKAIRRFKLAPREANPPPSTSGANLYAQFHV